MASSSTSSTETEISNKPATGGQPVIDKEDQDDQLLNQLYVGKSFSTFTDFQHALDKLKKSGNHPFRVFNSQRGENYSLKRIGRKYSSDPVDISKFEIRTIVYALFIMMDVTTSTKEDIATLLHITEKRIYLLFPEVQQQRNGSSCGLYALVFAQTLAEGKIQPKLFILMEQIYVLICYRAYWQGY